MPAPPSVQPTPPVAADKVLVDRSFVADATRAFKEVVALRDSLSKAEGLLAAGDATKIEMQRQIVALNAVVASYADLTAIKDRKEALYEQMIALHERIQKTLTAMLDRAVAQLNKPKSGWNRIVDFAKGALKILAGVAIGRMLND